MRKLLTNKWFLLIIMALTWGSSFILIKKSLLAFSPFQIGAFRVGLSGLVLAYIGLPGLLKMTWRDIFWVALTGLFGIFLPMFLFPIAQTQVSSSLAGIINSLEPIFVLVLGFLIFGARNKPVQVIGATLGFLGAGTLVYFSGGNNGDNQVGFTLLMVLASACYAISSLITKEKLQHVPAMHISAGLFTIWAVPALFILGFSGFFTEFRSTPAHFEALGYLSFLTLFGTTAAMALFYKLVQDTSAVFASSVSYLIPVVAVMWGIIDGENFIAWYLLGLLLILIGIYLIRERKKKPGIKLSATPGRIPRVFYDVLTRKQPRPGQNRRPKKQRRYKWR